MDTTPKLEPLSVTEYEYGGSIGPIVRLSKWFYFKHIHANPYDPNSGPYNGGHEDQIPLHKSSARFRLGFGGGRGGKSRGAAAEVGPIVLTPGTRGWIVAPQYDLGKFVFDYIVRDLQAFMRSAHGQELRFESFSYSPRQGRMYATIAFETGDGLERSSFEVKSGGPGHVGSLKGDELDWVIMEECGELTSPDAWHETRIRLRTRGGIALLTANPRGPGHWVHKTFLDWMDKPDHAAFVANADKNPGNAERSIDAASMPDDVYQRMVLGLSASKHGLVYDTFDRNSHVIDCRRLGIPQRGLQRWGGIDWGYADPMVALFANIQGKGKDSKVIVYREYRKAKRIIEQHAKHVRRWIDSDGGPSSFEGFFADHDPGNRATFRKHDVLCRKARKDICNGVDCVRELFLDGRLLIDLGCRALLRELATYEWGEGDKPQDGDDHSLDALRYLCYGLRCKHII